MSPSVRVSRTLALVLLASPRLLEAQPAVPLAAGVAVERQLTPGQVHRSSIRLSSGQFFHLAVEQAHVDLAVRVVSPDGSVVAEADNGIDRDEPLTLSLLASRDGEHRVEIRLRSRRSAWGDYRLMTEPPRASADDDRLRICAERRRGEADRLRARGTAESRRLALESYESVLGDWRQIGDRREEAATLGRMSDVRGELGDLREALTYAEEALALWRLEGDRRGEASLLDRVGLAHSELGDQHRALEHLEQALAMRQADGNARGVAESFNDIAVARGALGEVPEAIARYTDGLKAAQSSGDRMVAAVLLNNRAVDYRKLGETDRALVDLRAALERFRLMGDRHLEGITHYFLGSAHLDQQDVPRALRSYGSARSLLHETGDKRFEGFALNHTGLALLAADRPADAQREFEKSRELLRACGDERAEAMVAANIARARLEQGHPAEARAGLLAALVDVQASGDRTHEAIALVHLARAERALGNLVTARERLEEALRLTESLRGSIPGAGERASFMASTRSRYELLIEILMDLNAAEPGRGWDAEALHASERAKARSFVELLAEARINLREGIDEKLLARERDLEAELEARRRQEQRRLAGPAPAPVRSDAGSRSLDSLLAEYADTQGQLRTASPRYAALARPQPLTLDGIRERILDKDTVLLEYALGESRSFLWAATATSLTSYELPRRAVIEAAARQLYAAWSASGRVDAAEMARRARVVSRMLLGPAADRLEKKRLAIVAEGALLYLPFTALPSPGRRGGALPLVAEHDVVTLPSATTLAVLREEASGRSPSSRRVAVLADPVFDAADSRVSGGSRAAAPSAAGNDALTRSMQESGLRRLERLIGSRSEAEAIVALTSPGESLAALDFEASRETALGAGVSSAGIVHIASHGLLNSRHPELSGIVLSLVDGRGRTKDGFLQTRDIYKLKLSADLVVLSACQTALGKDVRGEGLVGLSRGFMYAGAPRVVASLWRVPDRATAELMKHFYRGMLVQGLPPAAALNAAQRLIRREKLWVSPYYWAAFTLQGDWR